LPALHGRLLVETVLRPFGEHLAAMVGARTGDTCVDVSGDGGVMPALLSNAAGATGACIAVDDSPEVLRELDTAAAMLHRTNLRTLLAPAAALPLPTAGAQVATSLFALAHAPGPGAALAELVRVVAPRGVGRLACAAWSEPDAAPHEGILQAALREVTGRVPDALARALQLGYPEAPEQLVATTSGAAGVQVVRIHDVVRFDGAAHYWAAMVTERPIAKAVAALPERTAAAVRERATQLLAPYAAADGTLRIPTEAVVIVRSA
jgi:SAM-dependent methyltransferase